MVSLSLAMGGTSRAPVTKHLAKRFGSFSARDCLLEIYLASSVQSQWLVSTPCLKVGHVVHLQVQVQHITLNYILLHTGWFFNCSAPKSLRLHSKTY